MLTLGLLKLLHLISTLSLLELEMAVYVITFQWLFGDGICNILLLGPGDLGTLPCPWDLRISGLGPQVKRPQLMLYAHTEGI